MVGRVFTALWLGRAAVCASLLLYAATVGAAKSGDLATSDWPTKDWSVVAPEAEGLDSGALADLVEWGKAERVDSLLVVRHGKIVLDAYYAPFKPGIRHDLRSVTKSFVGTLSAIAVRDHFLDSVDHPVVDFFKDKAVAHVDDRKKAIRVQHLLDMSSGFEWKEDGYGADATLWRMYKSPDPTKFVLDQPMKTRSWAKFLLQQRKPIHSLGADHKANWAECTGFRKERTLRPTGHH